MLNEIVTKHMALLSEIDASFEINKIIFKEEGLHFESDPPSYWLVKKDDDQIHISPDGSIAGFRVVTNKDGSRKEDIIPIQPAKAIDKFRSRDITFLIAECFDVQLHKPDGNLTEVQQERFYELSKRYLTYQGLDWEEVLESNHPKQLDAEVAAAALFEGVKNVLLSILDNPGAAESLPSLFDEYDKYSGADKLGYILDKAEKLADRFSI